jgi:hypothetical protein
LSAKLPQTPEESAIYRAALPADSNVDGGADEESDGEYSIYLTDSGRRKGR